MRPCHRPAAWTEPVGQTERCGPGPALWFAAGLAAVLEAEQVCASLAGTPLVSPRRCYAERITGARRIAAVRNGPGSA